MRLLVVLVALSTAADAATTKAAQEQPPPPSQPPPVPPPPPRLAPKRSSGQQQLTSCELLFSVCDNLASYCQCRDLIDAPPPSDADAEGAADQPASDNLPSGANTSSRNPINQLNCAAPSLGQVYQDLRRVATSAGAQLQLDHLNIVSNISAAGKRPTAGNANLIDSGAERARLQVDHLSFQLTLVGGGGSGGGGDDDGDDASDSGDVGAPLAAQMIDFVERPLNGTRLGSLAIYIVDAREPRPKGDKLPAARFDFGALWPALINLRRLELSVDAPRASVTLASATAGLPARLQWLNLASNRRLEGLDGGDSGGAVADGHEPGAPLKSLKSLEYLSLESSRLTRFPLFSALAHDMANLTSLNLANNRLKSASTDLLVFSKSSSVRLEANCAVRPTRHQRPRRFQLPSLLQLDLSRNQLGEFGSRACQLLVCLAPNLNQLYLQHNQLKRLSLSALLGQPIQLAALLDNQDAEESSSASSSSSELESLTIAPPSRNQLQLASQLEHIDLSHNLLERLIGWRGGGAPTRLKSINLAHNKLRRPTLDQFDARLANRLIFSETLDAPPGSQQVIDFGELQRNFQLINSSEPALTLCQLAAVEGVAEPTAGEQEAAGGELVLSRNQLERISSGDFSSKQCASIQILRLDGNSLVELAERSLVQLKGLQQLDLSSNKLVALAEQLFSENARLRSVDVSGNRLAALRENQLAALPELEELRLADNSLVELKANQFQHNTRLRSIDLARNRLAHLEAGCFAHLKSLRQLDLSGNRLREIHLDRLFKLTNQPARGALAVEQPLRHQLNPGPTTRQRAAKSRSHKSSTGKSSLKNAASEKLKHSYEKRRADKTRRQAGDPANLDGLDEPGEGLLVLSSNQLESLDVDCDRAGASFARGVRSLRLDDNRLTKLSGKTLNCFKALQVLDARSNLIESLNGAASGAWSRLVRLDLANNRLGGTLNLAALFPLARQPSGTETTTTTTTTSEPRLEGLSLSGNPNLTLPGDQLLRLVEAAPLRQLHLARISAIVVGSPADSPGKSSGDESGGRILDELSLSSIGRVDEQFLRRLLDANLNLVESIDRLDLENVRLQNSSTHISFWGGVNALLASKRVAVLNVANNQLDAGRLADLLSASAFELSQLNASFNLVDRWPLTGARFAAQLKLLDLSHNRLRHLLSGETTTGSNEQLVALEHLDLSSNAMVSLTESPTSSRFKLRPLAPNLVHLDLSDNRLSWLPAEFFEGLDRLSTLRLSRNQLETLNLQLSNPASVLVDLASNRNLRSIGHAPRALLDTGIDDDDGDQAFETNSKCALSMDRVDLRLKPLNLDEYMRQEIAQHRDRNERRASRLELSGLEKYNQEEASEPLGDASSANRCQNLPTSIRSIDLANSLTNRNKLTIENLSASQPAKYHLSLRQNRLDDEFQFEVPPNSSALNVIGLDLSENQLLQRLPNAGQFCNLFPGLRSLFLARNQFKQVPLGLGEQCQQLALTDLSNNMLAHLSDRSVEILLALPGLQVLKLDGNRLGSWRPVEQVLGSSSLSLLDVRDNGLGPQQTSHENRRLFTSGSPTTVVLSEANLSGQTTRELAHRYQLGLSNDSLTLSWNGSAANNKSVAQRKLSLTSLTKADERQTLESKESKFVVRFCSLSRRAPTRLCLFESTRVELTEACLLLKPPSGPMCLTNLDDQQPRPSQREEAPSTAPHILFPLNQVSKPKPGNETSPAGNQQDLILHLIEQLKVGWLQLKGLDFNEYLASLSNIKHDSVWLTIDGKYPVYTLTVLKFAIVVASVCIIVLLVAMFALLTYLYQSNGRERFATTGASASSNSSASSSSSSSSCGRGHDDSTGSPRSDSEEMTDLTVTMSQSGSSARSANNKTPRGRASGCSTERGAGAAGDSSHFCFGNNFDHNSTNQNSAAKRAPPRETKPFNQLDPGLLLGQQQQCPTPSSSLAPSSVETAETMQAVDSIRSGPSGQVAFNQGAPANYQLSSVDQYNEAGYAPIGRGQQPPAPVVATVMRMVKSSSANDFEANQATPASLHNRQQLYGTLSRHNERANCSTLRSKIRANQQRYSRVYPATLVDLAGSDRFSQDSGVSTNNYQTRVQQQQQSIGTLVESATFEPKAHELRHTNDLDPTTLSLLSINTALSSGNLNNSAATSQQVSPATFVIDHHQQQQPARGLCQFHHNLARPSQEQMIERANPEIILEREEEHYPFEDSLFFEVHDIMPPPPPPPPS